MAGDRTWRNVPLSTLCEAIYDGPHATPKKTPNGPIFLGISNLAGGRLDLSETEHLSEDDYMAWTRRVTPQPGDIVFSYETRLGEAAIIPEGLRCCLGRRMGLLRVDRSRADPLFLLYAYLGPDFQDTIRQRTIYGSTVERILLTELGDFPICIPPLPEQRAIARVLGALDDKIELNRKMNATLEAMARALFQSWFVDFDPVRAKAAGRAPHGMDAATAALFPDGFEVVDGREVPRGWRVEPIGDLVRVVGGSTPSTSESTYWEGGTIHWATPKDLSALSSPILLDTERYITDTGLRQISSGLLPQGTVLLSSRAPIGYLAIAEVPTAINQGFIGMVCEAALPNYYVLLWAKANMEAIKSRANGTTFLEISKANFRPMQVIVPSQHVLKAFVDQVKPWFYKITTNLRQISTLAALRDALLPKLLSGELRVPEAMRAVEEAV